jgi:hypothetical protein
MTLRRASILAETIARYCVDDDPFEALSSVLAAFALLARAAASDVEKREPYPMRTHDVARWKLAADRAIADSLRHQP